MSVQRLYDILSDNALLGIVLEATGDIRQGFNKSEASSYPSRCVRFWGAGYNRSIGGVVESHGFVIAALAKDGMLIAEAIMKATVNALVWYQEGGLLRIDLEGAVGPYWSDELQAWRADIRVVFISTH